MWNHMIALGPDSWNQVGGIIMWILIIVLIAAAVFWLIRTGSTGISGGQSQSDPIEIIRRRFAKGEITRDEYLSLKQELDKEVRK